MFRQLATACCVIIAGTAPVQSSIAFPGWAPEIQHGVEILRGSAEPVAAPALKRRQNAVERAGASARPSRDNAKHKTSATPKQPKAKKPAGK